MHGRTDARTRGMHIALRAIRLVRDLLNTLDLVELWRPRLGLEEAQLSTVMLRTPKSSQLGIVWGRIRIVDDSDS